MKRIFFLLAIVLLTQFPVSVLADKGQQKNSETVEAKKEPPVEVAEVDRVCGFSESSFIHTEQGSSFNYGVSSVGSGVWGGGYNSQPVARGVYASSYGCSPKKFKHVTAEKEFVE